MTAARELEAGPGSGPCVPGPRPSRLATVLLLAGVALFLVALQVWRPGFFLWDDNATYYLPCFDFALRTLLTFGQPAQLDFHQYLGVPFLASGQTTALYPPAYAATATSRLVFGDSRWAIDLAVALHLLVAAWGMERLLGRLGARRGVAAAAAGLWVTFPFVVQVAKSWVFVAFVAALLPWLALFVERTLRGRDPAANAGLAATVALLLFQGYVQYALLGLLGIGLWATMRVGLDPELRPQGLARLGRCGATVAAGVGLAAPLVLPMLAAKARSADRAGTLSYAELVSNALDPAVAAWAQLFVHRPRAVHQATGAIFYVGLPVVALVVVAVLLARNGRRATVVAALATAATMLLLSTRLWGLLHGWPFVGSFRWPFKAFLLALFFATVGAALGADALVGDGRRSRRLAGIALLAAGLAGNLGIVFTPSLDRAFGVNRFAGSVTAFRAATADRLGGREGRVVSLWLEPETPRIERFLPFRFATLAGVDHLGGYEPLVPATHLRLARKLEYSNIFRYELTPAALDELAGLGVRFYLVPDDPGGRERFLGRLAPRLHRLGVEDGVAVWEDGEALPLASFAASPRTAVRVERRPSGLRLFPEGGGGTLDVRIAPLPGYVASADGVDLGAPELSARGTLRLEVPAGTREVALRYVDLPLRLGTAIALAVALPWLAIALRRRLAGRRLSRSA